MRRWTLHTLVGFCALWALASCRGNGVVQFGSSQAPSALHPYGQRENLGKGEENSNTTLEEFLSVLEKDLKGKNVSQRDIDTLLQAARALEPQLLGKSWDETYKSLASSVLTELGGSVSGLSGTTKIDIISSVISGVQKASTVETGGVTPLTLWVSISQSVMATLRTSGLAEHVDDVAKNLIDNAVSPLQGSGASLSVVKEVTQTIIQGAAQGLAATGSLEGLQNSLQQLAEGTVSGLKSAAVSGSGLTDIVAGTAESFVQVLTSLSQTQGATSALVNSSVSSLVRTALVVSGAELASQEAVNAVENIVGSALNSLHQTQLTPETKGTLAQGIYQSILQQLSDLGMSPPVSQSIAKSIAMNSSIKLANARPVASPPRPQSLTEGSSFSFQLEAWDPEGNPLAYSCATGCPAGSVLSPYDGIFSWTPGFESAGEYDLLLRAFDGEAETLVPLRLVVKQVDLPPVGTGLVLTGQEDTPLLIQFRQGTGLGYTDLDNDAASGIVVQNVSNGTLGEWSCVNGICTATFTPTSNFIGTTSFDYKVTANSSQQTVWASVTMNFGDADDSPIGTGRTISGSEDTALSVSIGAGAGLGYLDPEGHLATSIVTQNAVGGTLGSWTCVAGTCSALFTPTANFNGTARFEYKVTANSLQQANWATYTLNLSPVNDAPTLALGSGNATTQDIAAGGSMANITLVGADVDGDSLTFVQVAGSAECPNITIHSTTGVISGTLPLASSRPADSKCDLGFRVQDSTGIQSSTFVVTIYSNNRTPSINCTNTSQTGNFGMPISTSCSYADLDVGSTLSYSVSGACGANLSVNASGVVSGIIPSGTACSGAVAVSDGTANASASVTLTPTSYTVGGTVTGLTGSGLVLANSGNTVTINAAGSFTFASQYDGSAYAVSVQTQPTTENCLVSSSSGILNHANVTSVTVTCTPYIKKVVGGLHTCILYSHGKVKCWGTATYGALGYANGTGNHIGDNETPLSASLGYVDVGGTVTDLSAAENHTCALLSSGAVRCWGRGTSGRLGYASEQDIGDGETPASVGDVNVGGIVTQISAGFNHSCALLSTGKVRCWGVGTNGRLGYGNTLDIGDDEHPFIAGDVNLGANAVYVSAGENHTCAILEGGSVICWGNNNWGQLGLGHTNVIGDDEIPAAAGVVNLGGQASKVVTGENVTCALLTTGNVRCWGHGFGGRHGYANSNTLGDDEHPASLGNVNVGGTVTDITGINDHICALLSGGTVTCWGENVNGWLGYGHTNSIGDNESPASAGNVSVGGTVNQVSATSQNTCLLMADGGIKCWGFGSTGQHGYGHTNTLGDNELPSSYGNVPLPPP